MGQPPIIDLRATLMDDPPPPRRRRRRHKSRRAVVYAVSAFLIPLGLYFVLAPKSKDPWGAGVAAIKPAAQNRTGRNPLLDKRTTGRPVYPYSVIPGGAYNLTELARAMDSDPVVARHYQEFDRSKLTTTRSLSARPVYVSYRVGDTIYWSRKPIRLNMGELLITDGTHFARARCGNRIALAVESPVAHTEPLPAVLDTPVFGPELAALPLEEIAPTGKPLAYAEIRPAPAYPAAATGVPEAHAPGWLLPVAGGGAIAGIAIATRGGSRRPVPNGGTPLSGGETTPGGGTIGGGSGTPPGGGGTPPGGGGTPPGGGGTPPGGGGTPPGGGGTPPGGGGTPPGGGGTPPGGGGTPPGGGGTPPGGGGTPPGGGGTPPGGGGTPPGGGGTPPGGGGTPPGTPTCCSGGTPPGGGPPPPQVVPEPSFYIPCLIGFGAIAIRAYRRKRSAQD